MGGICATGASLACARPQNRPCRPAVRRSTHSHCQILVGAPILLAATSPSMSAFTMYVWAWLFAFSTCSHESIRLNSWSYFRGPMHCDEKQTKLGSAPSRVSWWPRAMSNTKKT